VVFLATPFTCQPEERFLVEQIGTKEVPECG
jgi:hypothetical protein